LGDTLLTISERLPSRIFSFNTEHDRADMFCFLLLNLHASSSTYQLPSLSGHLSPPGTPFSHAHVSVSEIIRRLWLSKRAIFRCFLAAVASSLANRLF
jgi:hypothetical protein